MPEIIMSEQHQITEFDAIAAEFFGAILSLDYSACFVSDESSLSDFFGCGMPDDLPEGEIDVNALYDQWDAWVIAKIAEVYGIQIEATTLSMVDLFNRIQVARSQLIH